VSSQIELALFCVDFLVLIFQQGKGSMAWVLLIVAGVLEVVWAYCMKVSDGFTKLTPSILTIIFMIASFTLLSYSMKSLPLGTAYTVWTGIGAVGSFAVGILFLGEPASAMRMLAAVLIISGLVLMKLSSA
jgi:quaternary ammonium compound-resistance protein SugE